MAVPSPSASDAPARWTVLDVLRWTTTRFEERKLASPRLDAEILTAHALGTNRVQLYVQYDRPLTPAELATLRELVKRRQGGDSVAYIVGKKEFFGLELAVDRRVLVPRPDTETLVDEALARLDPAAPTPHIADVGTGSGAIAIAIAMSRPAARIVATDVSPEALVVARENAARHGSAVTFLEGDLDVPLRALAPFDLIAANLPYIPTADIAALAPEVRAEPSLALDGGPDGLALVRRLVAAAPALLVSGGALVLEIGAGQALATATSMEEAGFVEVRRRRDLGEVERVVSGQKP